MVTAATGGEAGAGAVVPPPSSWRIGSLVLVEAKLGRIALHLACALRTGRFVWHWHGIVRFVRKHPESLRAL